MSNFKIQVGVTSPLPPSDAHDSTSNANKSLSNSHFRRQYKPHQSITEVYVLTVLVKTHQVPMQCNHLRVCKISNTFATVKITTWLSRHPTDTFHITDCSVWLIFSHFIMSSIQ